MPKFRQELIKTIEKWEVEAAHDPADKFTYKDLLDDLLYHGDLRFRDYVQFSEDGPFPYRLKRWLDNTTEPKQKKIMFRLLRWLIFVDNKQMQSLYRDAFRSKIIPWISDRRMTVEAMLAADYQHQLLTLLKQYYLCSITESFDVSFFKQINSLVGLPKLEILGENVSNAERHVSELAKNRKKKGLIIFEDMVGTGNQAAKVLRAISKKMPTKWRSLFVPLIVQHIGLDRLMKDRIANLEVYPVLVIPKHSCIQEDMFNEEPDDFKYFRSIIKTTSARVIERLNPHDDVPKNCFGYEGSGALVVTAHNTPNNTVPLLHHRAPDWFPLFRRVHHRKDD